MRWRLAFVVLILVLASATPALAGRMYWGARIAGPVYGGGDAPFDWTSVEKFTAGAHKKPSIIHFYAPFAKGCGTSGCSFFPFNKSAFQRIRRHGMIPMISWNSASMPLTKVQSNFQNKDIVNGRYDSFIRNWAKAAKAWGHPFFLRFDREMNGTWFPWSPGVNGNTASDFVAAWRHVHRIFDDVGANNATWTWCPNVDPNRHFTGYRSLYPGNRFVDWTCLDGYNFAGHWRSFSRAYRRSYRVITSRIAPHKPMIIGEVASSETGGSKASWIKDMLGTQLRGHYPKIKGFLWFNDRTVLNRDWPIETSASAKNAFANGIASRHYASASSRFSTLRSKKIRPLR